jgi:hypothetical protein
VSDRNPDPSIDRIRDHVRAQVARTSLRKVAARAGAKVGATKKFVDGSVPYERNLRLWKRFYARDLREGLAGRPDDALPPAEAAAVLELLLWGFDDGRTQAVREAAEAFRSLFVRHGRPPPAWVLALAGTPGEPLPGADEDDGVNDDEPDDDGED